MDSPSAPPADAGKRGPITSLRAVDIARGIAQGEFSAIEVVEAFIARIEEVDPKIRAVVLRFFETARAEARAVDARRARGEPLGPLAGVPVTIKECFDMVGTPSTYGVPWRIDHRADTDDPYVARYRAAGAIPLAKTNLPQFMFFTECDNPVYGRTDNPWNAERSSGGSSGGEGAIIGAAASPLGLGNDIGGSLRIPSAFCGITAIRPTAGRLPDHCNHGLPVGQTGIVSQVGPMARSVDDLVLALRVLDNGRDIEADPGPPLGDPDRVDLKELRVAMFTDDGDFPVSPALRRAIEASARWLAEAGAAIVPWQPPSIARANELFFGCLSGDRGRTLKKLARGGKLDYRMRVTLLLAGMPPWLRRIGARTLAGLGQRRTAAFAHHFAPGTTEHYWSMVEGIADYREEFRAALDACNGGPADVILFPPYAVPAQRHGASFHMPMPGAYTMLANLTGYPAGVVPVTRVRKDEESDRPISRDLVERTARETEIGSAGLPVGVQVMARPWRDHVALAVMGHIERRARREADFPLAPPI